MKVKLTVVVSGDFDKKEVEFLGEEISSLLNHRIIEECNDFSVEIEEIEE